MAVFAPLAALTLFISFEGSKAWSEGYAFLLGYATREPKQRKILLLAQNRRRLGILASGGLESNFLRLFVRADTEVCPYRETYMVLRLKKFFTGKSNRCASVGRILAALAWVHSSSDSEAISIDNARITAPLDWGHHYDPFYHFDVECKNCRALGMGRYYTTFVISTTEGRRNLCLLLTKDFSVATLLRHDKMTLF